MIIPVNTIKVLNMITGVIGSLSKVRATIKLLMTAKVVITPAVAVSMYLSAATVSKSASPVPIRPKLPTIIGVVKVG